MKFSGDEGFLVVGDFEVIYVEALAEGLVEETTDLVVGGGVEVLGVLKEVQGVTEEVGPEGEFFAGVDESGFDAGAVLLQAVQLGADLGLGHGAVRGEVDEAGFLFVDEFELSVQGSVALAGVGLLVGEDRFEKVADVGDEVGRKLQGAVVVNNRLFDQFGTQVRQIAEAVLPGATEEVGVELPAATFDLTKDEARGAPLSVAAVAEDAALEIVIVDAVTLPLGAAGIEDFLHGVEQFGAMIRTCGSREGAPSRKMIDEVTGF
ncbi:hypothetical protein [Nocardia farcinica]|uniref:hypothetical protein n=1 Tax=Nocardia farcinica TaxID=37329 RepID=UPI001E4E3BB6|nr:hypothetical protein [Nocardia farcinica]